MMSFSLNKCEKYGKSKLPATDESLVYTIGTALNVCNLSIYLIDIYKQSLCSCSCLDITVYGFKCH